VQATPGVRHEDGLGPAGGAALHLQGDLTHVDLGHHEGLHPLGELGDPVLGERPYGDELQQADLQPLLAGDPDGPGRRASRDAVGHDHDVSVVVWSSRSSMISARLSRIFRISRSTICRCVSTLIVSG